MEERERRDKEIECKTEMEAGKERKGNRK